jgi:acetyl-CoA carboxylase biotin carboxyl carrier protein
MASDQDPEAKGNAPDESNDRNNSGSTRSAANLADALPQPPTGTLMVERVKMLAQALSGSDVSELDLTEDGARILIRRQLDAPIVRLGRSAGRGRTSGLRNTSPEGEPPSGTPAGIAIVAPLTGVFYGSPSPSSPAFVELGDTVQAGQVVCIVEAMKVFNDIKSEISGTVTAIVAQNGNLVQKGEALIRVKPI